MTWTDLAQIISTIGFPIAVAVYLLTTFNKTLITLNHTIQEQTATLAKLCEKLNDK